ncbi:hypothetical protein [Amycolatopsis thermoflava]|uniref:hypothetical protein n=1 Tax=Amycolatopsis thermoflava TaxID=84480 RepID=UPI003EB955B7
MPKLIRSRVKHRMAELAITSTQQLATETGIPWGSLRNALAGRDPITLARVYALARALTGEGENFRVVAAEIVADRELAAEILANNDGVPDEPPPQPKRPSAPPPRRSKDPRAPKRVAGAAA